jgi:peptidoglycan/LPS O-acetylase OafA/YrhL
MPGTRADTRFTEFQQLKRFTPLDGLRGISIALVVTAHVYDPIWTYFHGAVVLFFVLSGFLITTLLLREQHNTGGISVTGFYVRRIFRILPLYYVCLIGYTILILGLHLNGGESTFRRDLPLYLTYNNEFEHGSTFGHTWSLAVQEKYYLVWPVIAFAVPFLARRRLALAAALTASSFIAAWTPWSGLNYFGLYSAILVGCVTAILMHDRATFDRVAVVSKSSWSLAALTAYVLAVALIPSATARNQAVALITAVLIVATLSGNRWLAAGLSRPWLTYIGTRSYAIYLIHPIVKNFVDLGLASGSHNVAVELIRYGAVLGISLLVAEVTYRLIEQPMIQLGRRVTHSRRSPRTVPAELEPWAVSPAAPPFS